MSGRLPLLRGCHRDMGKILHVQSGGGTKLKVWEPIAKGDRYDKTILGDVRLDVGEGWSFVMDGAAASFKLEAGENGLATMEKGTFMDIQDDIAMSGGDNSGG